MTATGRISVQGIDDNLWTTFKENVQDKYGKLHTVLGQEVEKALRAYMEQGFQNERTHTHQKEKKNDEKKPIKYKTTEDVMVGKTREERIQNIGKLLVYGSGEISNIGIRRLIATQKVGDKRVIESYIETMRFKGWLELKKSKMVVMQATIADAINTKIPEETLMQIKEDIVMYHVEGNGGIM